MPPSLPHSTNEWMELTPFVHNPIADESVRACSTSFYLLTDQWLESKGLREEVPVFPQHLVEAPIACAADVANVDQILTCMHLNSSVRVSSTSMRIVILLFS